MKSFNLTKDRLPCLFEYLLEVFGSKSRVVVLLRGDLASGKTTLVSEFLKFRSIDGVATSPTFGILNIYGNIYHYDFYNKSTSALLELGILDMLDKDGIHFVEWGGEDIENLLRDSGFDVVLIFIDKSDNSREYRVCI